MTTSVLTAEWNECENFEPEIVECPDCMGACETEAHLECDRCQGQGSVHL